jgi:flagellin
MATPLAITTNIGSVIARKNINQTNRLQHRTIQRLSSGLRLNSAADDAAGMAVATGLRAQLRGYRQAERNMNDGIAILQIAEGSYVNLSDILIRLRELSVQAASDGLTNKERLYLDDEFQELKSEIDRVSAVTEFNGQNLLDGTAGTAGVMTFQVGTRNTGNDQITVTLPNQSAAALGVGGSNVTTLTTAQTAIDEIDTALDNLATDRASLGATINKLTSATTNMGVTIENVSDSLSVIRDVDMATESTTLAKAQVLQQAGVAMLATSNQIPQLALRLLG